MFVLSLLVGRLQFLGVLSGVQGLDELLNLGALGTDGQEVGISGVVLLMNSADVLAEYLTHSMKVLGRLHHDLTGIAFGDLDVALKDSGVAENQFQGGNGHGLRNGNEVEYTLLAHTSHVEETLFNMLHGVQNHFRRAVQSLLTLRHIEQILPLVDVLAPDLLGVPAASFFPIFVNVTNDVCLLQELSHGLGERWALSEFGVGKFRCDKQLCQALAHQTSDVMTVKLVFVYRLDTVLNHFCVLGIISHAIAHLDGHLLDNVVVFLLELLKFGDNDIELFKQLLVLFIALVELPTINLHGVVEVSKEGNLLLERNRHIIFDGVEATQDEVEKGDGGEELVVQFLNDGSKTSTRQVEKSEAFFEGRGLVGRVSLVDRIMPKFPGGCVSDWCNSLGEYCV